MKSTILTVFLICVYDAKASELSESVKQLVQDVVAQWKSGEIQGKFPFEIPNIDPLPVPPFCNQVNKIGVKVSVETGPINIYGLKALKVENIVVSDTAQDIEVFVTVPKLLIHADYYKLNGKAMMQKVAGTGKLDIVLYGGSGSGKFHMQPNNDDTGTILSGIKLNVHVKRAQGKIQGVNKIINNLITKKGDQLVEEFDQEINDIARVELGKLFREPLSTVRFDDLLNYTRALMDGKGSRRDGFSLVDLSTGNNLRYTKRRGDSDVELQMF